MSTFVGIGLGPIQTGIFLAGAAKGGFDRIVIAEVNDKLKEAVNAAGSVTINIAAADHVYETYGLTPVFFPIEPRLDVAAAQRVIARMKAPHYLMTEPYTAAQTIGILSRMKVVVSMRLHGLIFAAGQGVPLVGIVYDQKVSSFLSYIGQDLYEDLGGITAEGLMDLIDRAVERGRDPQFLSESVEKLRRMEAVNRQVLREYFPDEP